MTRYVVKNQRGEYLRFDGQATYSWSTKRRERMVWMSDVRAHERAKEHGGKVYRLRKTSAKRERGQVVKFLRAQAETPIFRACRSVLRAAATGIEDGEHWTIFRGASPQESK